MHAHYFLLGRRPTLAGGLYVDGLYVTDYDREAVELLRELEPDLYADQERDLRECMAGLIARLQYGRHHLLGLYRLNAPSVLDRDAIVSFIKHHPDPDGLLKSALVRRY